MTTKTITISYDKDLFNQNNNMNVSITADKLTIKFSNISLGVTNENNGNMTTQIYQPDFVSTSSISGYYSTVSGLPISVSGTSTYSSLGVTSSDIEDITEEYHYSNRYESWCQ